ncbi:hypothetical protein J4Q44_G00094740 [Coregonus suidteri]|uniref:Uncharacterized protein n=1 Tax=Coregonus suidteri TaxID=861788 RepID=A0AAN8M6V8_9TELE
MFVLVSQLLEVTVSIREGRTVWSPQGAWGYFEKQEEGKDLGNDRPLHSALYCQAKLLPHSQHWIRHGRLQLHDDPAHSIAEDRSCFARKFQRQKSKQHMLSTWEQLVRAERRGAEECQSHRSFIVKAKIATHRPDHLPALEETLSNTSY